MTTEQTTLLLLAVAGIVVASSLRGRFRHEFIVNDGFTGLLYHEGRLVETLAAGRHVRWGRNFRLTVVDVRRMLLQVPGQEVLSADHVGVKLSVVLTVRTVDAAQTVQAADNHVAHLYSAAQTAVRTVVAGVTLEALLSERLAIGAQLRELIAPQAEAVGVQLHAAEVRDVMLPGELRKAFSETLKARQEGQAALERARAESAALRNLANAARLLEGQPALATLRFLQTLETPGAGRALVMNDLAALLPALSAPGRKPGTSQPGET
jgi:regulator of protease activity HflC (stomatin/prohibitin superfamily)